MGSFRLLIVDDEPSLLPLLQRYLERLGYQTDVAGTAEDALARFQASPDLYACVLTDMKLPGMGGEELLQRLRQVRPGLPALISSGYPYQVRGEPGSAETGFLLKPYLPAMLAEEIERLLRPRASKTKRNPQP